MRLVPPSALSSIRHKVSLEHRANPIRKLPCNAPLHFPTLRQVRQVQQQATDVDERSTKLQDSVATAAEDVLALRQESLDNHSELQRAYAEQQDQQR